MLPHFQSNFWIKQICFIVLCAHTHTCLSSRNKTTVTHFKIDSIEKHDASFLHRRLMVLNSKWNRTRAGNGVACKSIANASQTNQWRSSETHVRQALEPLFFLSHTAASFAQISISLNNVQCFVICEILCYHRLSITTREETKKNHSCAEGWLPDLQKKCDTRAANCSDSAVAVCLSHNFTTQNASNRSISTM